jgi:hypothetical protein
MEKKKSSATSDQYSYIFFSACLKATTLFSKIDCSADCIRSNTDAGTAKRLIRIETFKKIYFFMQILYREREAEA